MQLSMEEEFKIICHLPEIVANLRGWSMDYVQAQLVGAFNEATARQEQQTYERLRKREWRARRRRIAQEIAARAARQDGTGFGIWLEAFEHWQDPAFRAGVKQLLTGAEMARLPATAACYDSHTSGGLVEQP